MKKNNLYRIALCALPVIALLAGCGDKSATTTSTPPSTAAPASGPVAGATNTQPGAKTNYTVAPEAAAYQQKMGSSTKAPGARN